MKNEKKELENFIEKNFFDFLGSEFSFIDEEKTLQELEKMIKEGKEKKEIYLFLEKENRKIPQVINPKNYKKDFTRFLKKIKETREHYTQNKAIFQEFLTAHFYAYCENLNEKKETNIFNLLQFYFKKAEMLELL